MFSEFNIVDCHMSIKVHYYNYLDRVLENLDEQDQRFEQDIETMEDRQCTYISTLWILVDRK